MIIPTVVLGILIFLDYGCMTSARTQDVRFTINITMPNFNTTQVIW